MTPLKIVVLGGTGFVGRLVRVFQPGNPVLGEFGKPMRPAPTVAKDLISQIGELTLHAQSGIRFAGPQGRRGLLLFSCIWACRTP